MSGFVPTMLGGGAAKTGTPAVRETGGGGGTGRTGGAVGTTTGVVGCWGLGGWVTKR